MPIGTSKIGVSGAGITIVNVPAGSCTLNTSGTIAIPTGVNAVCVIGEGGDGNPGNAGSTVPGTFLGGGGGGGGGGAASSSQIAPNPQGNTGSGGQGSPGAGPLGGSGGNAGNPGGTGSPGCSGAAGNPGNVGGTTSFAGINFPGGARGNGGTGSVAGYGGFGGQGGSSISRNSQLNSPSCYLSCASGQEKFGPIPCEWTSADPARNSCLNGPTASYSATYGTGRTGGYGGLASCASLTVSGGKGGGGAGSACGGPLCCPGAYPQISFTYLLPRVGNQFVGTANPTAGPVNFNGFCPQSPADGFRPGGDAGGGRGSEGITFQLYQGWRGLTNANPDQGPHIPRSPAPPGSNVGLPRGARSWQPPGTNQRDYIFGSAGGGGAGGLVGAFYQGWVSAQGAGGGASGNCINGAAAPGNPGTAATPITCPSVPVTPGASCPVTIGSPGGRVTVCWNATSYCT